MNYKSNVSHTLTSYEFWVKFLISLKTISSGGKIKQKKKLSLSHVIYCTEKTADL